MPDFSLKTYKKLLVSFISSGYKICGIYDYLKEQTEKCIVIRHDVDRKPYNSLAVARLEAELGISTTYYFRYYGSSNNPVIIKEIHGLNHEIGYHYETLAKAAGDQLKAKKLFEEQLLYFRTFAQVKTVSMHGSPLSKHHKYDIWKYMSLDEFNLAGDVFKSINYQGIYYFTDTGRAWNSISSNLRDRPRNCLGHPTGVKRDTESLIRFIKADRPSRVAITTHPERWSDDLLARSVQLCKDLLINLIKKILQFSRKS